MPLPSIFSLSHSSPFAPKGVASFSQSVDILSPSTTVFAPFILFDQTKKDDNILPIPVEFLGPLKQQCKFYTSKGMRYIVATDSTALTVDQYRKLGDYFIATAKKLLGIIFTALKNNWVFEDFANFVIADKSV